MEQCTAGPVYSRDQGRCRCSLCAGEGWYLSLDSCAWNPAGMTPLELPCVWCVEGRAKKLGRAQVNPCS